MQAWLFDSYSNSLDGGGSVPSHDEWEFTVAKRHCIASQNLPPFVNPPICSRNLVDYLGQIEDFSW
jgi:hypothetical protein